MKNELSKKTYLFIVSNVLKRTLALVALLHSPFFILHSSFIFAQEPQKGKASYYSKRATGSRTSSGERLHHDSLTCAHRTHPFGTMLKVTNVQNGKSVVVKVIDRGPYGRGRIIDLSWGAAKELGILSQGVAMVTVELADELVIPFKPKEDKLLYEIDFDTQDPGPVMTPVWQDMKKAQHKESKPLHKLGDNSTKNKQQAPAEKKNSVGIHQVVSHPQASVFDEIDKNPHKSRVSQKRNKDK
ncbi:MAG: septal ring lytic transglycosylase RlpA family protein [Prevotella sp.]